MRFPLRKQRYVIKHACLGMVGRLPRVRPEVLQPEDGRFYVASTARGGVDFAYPEREGGGTPSRLTSCLCTEGQLTSPAFRYWIERLGESFRMQRKLWEFGYIIQALHERDMLAEGKRGLVFAVGQEMLPSLFASMGCEIVASDLDASDERSQVWADTAQHASAVDPLNARDLCDRGEFARRVSFRPVDMNAIPSDLVDFDFTWSSCSFEHCGSIELGQQFIWRQMECLKPGGVAVHTTEFNLTSNEDTITNGVTVIFRRRDIEEIVRRLRDEGHHVEPLNLDVGSGPADRGIDRKPYVAKQQMKLQLEKYVSTSIGLIIRKAG